MNVQCFGMLKNIYDNMPSKDNAWIAGGALRSFLVADKVKDIDIFSYDVQKTLSDFRSDISFELRNENEFIANFYKNNLCYQVIKKYSFSGPQETIDNFDFTIICAAIGKDGVVTDPRFYIDNAQKRLVVKSLPKPLSTMKRALKYTSRGYLLCPVSLAKILKAIQERPINWENPSENEIEFYPDGTPTFRGLD
jgi:hypothetical protein